jgi:hypothetical protein
MYQYPFLVPTLVDDVTLQCPLCECDCLHHGRVEVFARQRENAPSRSVSVENGEIAPDTIGSNPSSRRDGILIYFDCEHCDLKELGVALTIRQHKGHTYIEWSAPSKALDGAAP